MLVLIVEDEASALMALRMIVEREGHDVLSASSATQAISIIGARALSGDAIHVALIDWSLGDGVGSDVARLLRTTHPRASTIMISGHSRDEMRSRWGDPLEGFLAFLPKPLDAETLKRYLQIAADSFDE